MCTAIYDGTDAPVSFVPLHAVQSITQPLLIFPTNPSSQAHRMPSIDSVLETAIYVDNLELAREFYGKVMGFVSMHDDERMSAYNAGPRSVFLIFSRGRSSEPSVLPGGCIPGHDSHGRIHMAFAISTNELLKWERHLAHEQVIIESRMKWPRGGESIYFRDAEGNLIELATPGLWPNY
jgi:catechol-2,3-dioxygenase